MYEEFVIAIFLKSSGLFLLNIVYQTSSTAAGDASSPSATIQCVCYDADETWKSANFLKAFCEGRWSRAGQNMTGLGWARSGVWHYLPAFLVYCGKKRCPFFSGYQQSSDCFHNLPQCSKGQQGFRPLCSEGANVV